MSIKKKTLPSGEVTWEIRIYENGRGSKRINRHFDRKSDAEVFLHQLKEEAKKRKLNPLGQVTFSDQTFENEAKAWLDDGKLSFSFSHIKRMEGIFKELFPKFGKLTLDRFTPELLSRYQKDEKSKGKANATVNRKSDTIVAILNYAVKQRRIPFNPSNGFKKLSKDHLETAFWDSKEARSFLNCMNELYPSGHSTRWIYVVYLLALNTAMRAGEIWGLQPFDLVEDGETIRVQRQFNRVTNDFGTTKGRKSRIVPCPKTLRDEIQNLIATHDITSRQTIFRNENGNPICHDNFTDRQFAKDLKLWDGRKVRFHDLRHTAATLMIANHVDVKTVKEICGHADISTTMNYVYMISGNVNKVAQTFSIEPESKPKVAALRVV